MNEEMDPVVKKIEWEVKDFAELTPNTLYEILHLRSQIFVVEQNDVYLDADYNDQHAIHIMGKSGDKIIAYCRVFRAGDYYSDAASIGRVLVIDKYRGKGVGRDMLRKALALLENENKIVIAAQLYLQSFYDGFGFIPIGEPYYDGTIKHIKMEL